MLQPAKNIYHLLQAILANVVYGFPSKKLKVIAITGTDGKTTTTTLLYHILKDAGYKVALISTVAAYIGHDEIDTGFHVTTPSPFSLQKLLRKIAGANMEYVILETTSHGIDQQRIWGVTPSYAAITNVTHEHLDYHKTYESYLATKAKLLLAAPHAYVNRDAKESATLLLEILKDNGFQERKDGESDLPSDAKLFEVVSAFDLSSQVKAAVSHRFGHEQYNAENTAIAAKIAGSLGIREKVIAKAITHFPGVPGRMQEVAKVQGVRFVVDFAHTPAALEQALKATRLKLQTGKGRLILVFGCAGLRDHTKRPMMGDTAARLADLVVLTAEDPRTEDVWAIIAQIKSGVQKGSHAKIVSIPDRYEAISFAYRQLAKPGDTVLITGKGHEKSMAYGGVEYPWNDSDAVRRVIAEQEDK